MRLGDVVTDGKTRGQVEWINGRGINAHLRMFVDDCYVIRLGPGTHRIGDGGDNWSVVPAAEWTRAERVRHVWLTYQRPDWLDEDDEPQGIDTMEWQLLRAITDDDTFDEWTSEDWPDDLELWRRVGDYIDTLAGEEGHADPT